MEKNIIKIYKDNIGEVELVDHMGDDATIVNAARVSFNKRVNSGNEISKKDKELIEYLLKNNHSSPFEHCMITFRFKVPLFVRSQHHRHRTWAYNEVSRRYTDENIEFYEPEEFRTQHKINRQASNNEYINPYIVSTDERGYSNGGKASELLKMHNKLSFELYSKMISAGIAKEMARGVLPMNTYTEYFGTVSLHNFMHFIDLRAHEGAQWEIRKMAEAALELIEPLYPTTICAYKKIKNIKQGENK